MAGGLALLTKSPAALLPPLVALIALVGLRHAPRRIFAPLVAWGATALAVWRVTLGVYDPHSLNRLPLEAGAGLADTGAVDGENALLLRPVVLGDEVVAR